MKKPVKPRRHRAPMTETVQQEEQAPYDPGPPSYVLPEYVNGLARRYERSLDRAGTLSTHNEILQGFLRQWIERAIGRRLAEGDITAEQVVPLVNKELEVVNGALTPARVEFELREKERAEQLQETVSGTKQNAVNEELPGGSI